jgi:hypothetical protein
MVAGVRPASYAAARPHLLCKPLNFLYKQRQKVSRKLIHLGNPGLEDGSEVEGL